MPDRLAAALCLGALVLVQAAAACAPAAPTVPGDAVPASVSAAPVQLGQRTRTTGCTARAGLPDPACTPGAVDPRVTPSNVQRTICVRGYTRTVRPPREVTDQIKRRQIQAYGAYVGGDPRAYELDHLVSLELGGAPADEANLWPEAAEPRPGFHEKDAVENWLHEQVCAGRLALGEAQRRIATDWRAVYDALPEAAKRQVGEGAGEGG